MTFAQIPVPRRPARAPLRVLAPLAALALLVAAAAVAPRAAGPDRAAPQGGSTAQVQFEDWHGNVSRSHWPNAD